MSHDSKKKGDEEKRWRNKRAECLRPTLLSMFFYEGVEKRMEMSPNEFALVFVADTSARYDRRVCCTVRRGPLRSRLVYCFYFFVSFIFARKWARGRGRFSPLVLAFSILLYALPSGRIRRERKREQLSGTKHWQKTQLRKPPRTRSM